MRRGECPHEARWLNNYGNRDTVPLFICFLTGLYLWYDNKQHQEHICDGTTPRERERERDDIWKKTAADKVNWRDRGAAEASAVFSSALGHICAGRADICDGATNIWEAATDIWKMSMPAAEGGYLDVWKRKKNYLCQSLRRDVNCLSPFSQCGFMWIYSWKTTHSWKTSYLIWLEVLHAHVLQRLLSKIE